MTNNLLTPLADIGIILILLFIASVITRATLFAIEALRRTVSKTINADSHPTSPPPLKRRQLPRSPQSRCESAV